MIYLFKWIRCKIFGHKWMQYISIHPESKSFYRCVKCGCLSYYPVHPERVKEWTKIHKKSIDNI